MPIIAAVRVLILGACMLAMSPIASAYTARDWHAASQAARNKAIVTRALQDVNRNLGMSCKVWAVKVVRDVSAQDVSLPLNRASPYDYLWVPDRNVVGMSTTINNVQPGWIIQMLAPRKGGGTLLHTAIVVSVSRDGVTFVESNYTFANAVDQRYISFADFNKQVKSWGVYYIL